MSHKDVSEVGLSCFYFSTFYFYIYSGMHTFTSLPNVNTFAPTALKGAVLRAKTSWVYVKDFVSFIFSLVLQLRLRCTLLCCSRAVLLSAACRRLFLTQSSVCLLRPPTSVSIRTTAQQLIALMKVQCGPWRETERSCLNSSPLRVSSSCRAAFRPSR